MKVDRGLGSAIASAAVLSVAMGFGRFAYTPLLVVMQRDAGLTVAASGYLASANLAGYLVGALVAMHGALASRRYRAVCFAALAIVLSTAAMALPQAFWIPARFVTGVGSGVAFVLTVSLALDRASRTGVMTLGVVFSGVGLGIASAGLLVPAFAALGGSRAAWLGIAATCAVLVALALPRLSEEPRPTRTTSSERFVFDAPFAFLSLAYGLEGFAYIIPATYLVAMIHAAPEIARYASFAWVVVGISAASMSTLWGSLGARYGKNAALLIALVAQALGLIAPIVLPGLGGALLLAITLGGTFVGIAAIASAIARDMRPHATSAALGLLTSIYGVAQIVGPLVAVRVSLATGSYRISLALAAFALLVAIVALASQASLRERSALPIASAQLDRRRDVAEDPRGAESEGKRPQSDV